MNEDCELKVCVGLGARAPPPAPAHRPAGPLALRPGGGLAQAQAEGQTTAIQAVAEQLMGRWALGRHWVGWHGAHSHTCLKGRAGGIPSSPCLSQGRAEQAFPKSLARARRFTGSGGAGAGEPPGVPVLRVRGRHGRLGWVRWLWGGTRREA